MGVEFTSGRVHEYGPRAKSLIVEERGGGAMRHPFTVPSPIVMVTPPIPGTTPVATTVARAHDIVPEMMMHPIAMVRAVYKGYASARRRRYACPCLQTSAVPQPAQMSAMAGADEGTHATNGMGGCGVEDFQ